MRRGALVLALALWSSAAHADEKPPFSIGSKPAWYVLGGATGGGTTVAHDRGWFLGGEVSVVRLRDAHFCGLYGDGYYDLNALRTYTTLGPEIGYKFLGIDGGGAARLGGRHAELGPTGRIFLTVGLVSLYARYAYFPEAIGRENDHVVQIGGLLKVPFAAWGWR